MSDQADKKLEEVTYTLEMSKDSKTVYLKIEAPEPIDTHILIVCLEEYLQDLLKAYSQAPDDAKSLH